MSLSGVVLSGAATTDKAAAPRDLHRPLERYRSDPTEASVTAWFINVFEILPVTEVLLVIGPGGA